MYFSRTFKYSLNDNPFQERRLAPKLPTSELIKCDAEEEAEALSAFSTKTVRITRRDTFHGEQTANQLIL